MTSLPDDVSDLCRRWRTRSLADGWNLPEDWAVPAAALFAGAVVSGKELSTHARALGAARSHSGVGIGESLRDLAALFEERGEVIPTDVVIAFARGWEQAADLLEPAVARAGMSGLDHVDEFRAQCERVGEGVRRARSDGRPVVVTVDGRAGVLGTLRRWERDVFLGEAVRVAFPVTSPTGYRDGVALALSWTASATDAPELAEGVDLLSDTLAGWAQARHGVLRDPARIVCAFAPLDHPEEMHATIERSLR
ncbi:hypothetical protein [Oerskovia flava]|uniref:hypothetical protein n=1 Tax=Oerskovia flava TaxID=2986422 RepID=UPI00223FF543|nr:hypothetical protein [Oerskovia sp. JB1-3-2]